MCSRHITVEADTPSSFLPSTPGPLRGATTATCRYTTIEVFRYLSPSDDQNIFGNKNHFFCGYFKQNTIFCAES